MGVAYPSINKRRKLPQSEPSKKLLLKTTVNRKSDFLASDFFPHILDELPVSLYIKAKNEDKKHVPELEVGIIYGPESDYRYWERFYLKEVNCGSTEELEITIPSSWHKKKVTNIYLQYIPAPPDEFDAYGTHYYPKLSLEVYKIEK